MHCINYLLKCVNMQVRLYIYISTKRKSVCTCGQYLRVANIYVWPIFMCGQYLRVANIHEYNREGYSSTIREPKQTASFITVPEGEGLYRLV